MCTRQSEERNQCNRNAHGCGLGFQRRPVVLAPPGLRSKKIQKNVLIFKLSSHTSPNTMALPKTMEFKTLRAEFDGVPRTLTRPDKPQNASGSRTFLTRQRAQSAKSISVEPTKPLARSGSSYTRPWVPPSRSPSQGQSFRMDSQPQLDLNGDPIPLGTFFFFLNLNLNLTLFVVAHHSIMANAGGLSLAEEREQSRRYRSEQATVRPLMTECEDRVDACTANMQHLVAELRTGMVVWSSLASAVSQQLSRLGLTPGASTVVVPLPRVMPASVSAESVSSTQSPTPTHTPPQERYVSPSGQWDDGYDDEDDDLDNYDLLEDPDAAGDELYQENDARLAQLQHAF
jgi:hypothetical protein